ncbi:unnamed protein product [Pieris macdunnoughi]|uniref:Gustatory receptor n=1 Tax=Pieris macdunnoughi TaxID=345717 RepID=A0A821UA05_9NEOP|nr:unnamed protein product [Pieris macdunnoughi]
MYPEAETEASFSFPQEGPREYRAEGECTVGGAHAFILRISRVFGLAPLRFEARGESWAVRVSPAASLYSYILVTVLVAGTVCGLCAEVRAGTAASPRMASQTAQLVSACDVLVVTLTAAAAVYHAPERMRIIIAFMDTVADVDESIGAHFSRSRERRVSGVMLAILVFFTLLVADDFCFYALQAKKIDRHWEVVRNYCGFYLLWFVVIVLELQFAFTALSVRARFRALNDALALTADHLCRPVEKTNDQGALNVFAFHVCARSRRNTAPPSRRNHLIVRRERGGGCGQLAVPAGEALERLAVLQGALCEALHRLDAAYGLPLALLLISTLMHLIVTPYFFIMEIIVSVHRIHFLVLQFLWCATHVLRILVVVEPCHYTITEGRRTAELVCRLLRAASSGRGSMLGGRLDLFSRQLSLQSVCYSPMGFCTLGRPLVASIFGAVTTYLVILIQFQRYDA